MFASLRSGVFSRIHPALLATQLNTALRRQRGLLQQSQRNASTFARSTLPPSVSRQTLPNKRPLNRFFRDSGYGNSAKQPFANSLFSIVAAAALVTSVFADEKSNSAIPRIFQMPNLKLPTDKVICGFGGQALGNIGFLGLRNGLSPAQLVNSVRNFMSGSHNHTQQQLLERGKTTPKDSYFFINETAYANSNDPQLVQDKDGNGELIVSITPYNIDSLIAQHRFSEEDASLKELNGHVSVVKADAFVTNVSTYRGKQFYLTVNGADAASLLLYDPENGVSAAVSCSWHVFAKGIPQQVVKEMVKLGAKIENIVVQVGPGLSPDSYEFGYPSAFCDLTAAHPKDGKPFAGARARYAPEKTDKYFKPHSDQENKKGKYLVNLPALLRDSLAEIGVRETNIHDNATEWDTFSPENCEHLYAARQQFPDENTRLKAAADEYKHVKRNGNFITTTTGCRLR